MKRLFQVIKLAWELYWSDRPVSSYTGPLTITLPKVDESNKKIVWLIKKASGEVIITTSGETIDGTNDI